MYSAKSLPRYSVLNISRPYSQSSFLRYQSLSPLDPLNRPQLATANHLTYQTPSRTMSNVDHTQYIPVRPPHYSSIILKDRHLHLRLTLISPAGFTTRYSPFLKSWQNCRVVINRQIANIHSTTGESTHPTTGQPSRTGPRPSREPRTPQGPSVAPMLSIHFTLKPPCPPFLSARSACTAGRLLTWHFKRRLTRIYNVAPPLGEEHGVQVRQRGGLGCRRDVWQ